MTPLPARTAPARSFAHLAPFGLLGVLATAVLCLPSIGADKDDPDKGPRDNPRGAMAFNLLRQKNEQGFIPRHGLLDAVKQLNAMRQQVGLQAKVAGLPVGVQVESKSLTPKVGGLTPGGWKWLGPGNVGGRTLVVLIHPRNPDILYAGTAGGGLWKTSDGGKYWNVSSDILGMVAVSSLVIDPNNPDVLYAGTGESIPADGIRGEGIWMTRDGGSTWQQLPETRTKDFDYVNRLAISADGKVLLAATNKGLFRKEGSSTSWDQVLKLNDKDRAMMDVRFHPRSSDQAIAGGFQGKAYYSGDGGKTWSLATGLPAVEHEEQGSGRVELTYAAADPNIVYASVDKLTGGEDDEGRSNAGELYRSQDGGKTYQLQNGQVAHLQGQGDYDNTVWAGDPTSADHVLIGGINVWRSTDGGKAFKKISEWWRAPQSAHADQHWIVSHPRYDGKDNKVVFFGTDGGVYKTDDITTVKLDEGWQTLNNNFGATQFYGGAGNSHSGTIIGGAQDNGTYCFTRAGGAQSWTPTSGGDGGSCAADPKEAKYFYSESQFLHLYRSEDGGRTSRPIYKDLPDAGKSANFIAPFVLDPNDSKVLLAGGASLWRCPDARAETPVWKEIKKPRATLIPLYGYISAIAVAQSDSQIVWVGYNDGVLYQSSNAQADAPTWKQLDEADPRRLPHRYCTRITIDPRNPKRVFVTFGGYYRGLGGYKDNNLWRTEDGGSTWTALTIKAESNEPLKAPVYDLVLHPSNPRCLYAATEVGIFASEDDGQHWSPTNEGPTYCSVQQLFWMDKTLVAVTHGRGMWQIDLSSVPAPGARR